MLLVIAFDINDEQGFLSVMFKPWTFEALYHPNLDSIMDVEPEIRREDYKPIIFKMSTSDFAGYNSRRLFSLGRRHSKKAQQQTQ
jgi:hypothetical protein